jgi:hypothetical protein
MRVENSDFIILFLLSKSSLGSINDFRMACDTSRVIKHLNTTSNRFMLPKRRFWKEEPTFQNHNSRVKGGMANKKLRNFAPTT